MPCFWVVIAYSAARYCISDTIRVYRLPSIGRGMRTAVYAVNLTFAAVAVFFSICLAVGPAENMQLHTAPFMCLVIVLPMVHLVQLGQRKQPLWYTTLTLLFFASSAAKFSFTFYALSRPGHHMPSTPARLVDGAWVALALLASFLMPMPPTAELSIEGNRTLASANLASALMAPVGLLLLLLWGPLAIVYHLSEAIILRSLAAVGLVGAPPDATPPAGQAAGAAKIPAASAYIGDVFGYASFVLHGWKPMLEASQKLRSGVFSGNYGSGFVVLTSADANEAAQAFRASTTEPVVYWQAKLFGGAEPFKGVEDAAVLKFHQQLCWKRPDGPEMTAAIEALRGELLHWAKLSANGSAQDEHCLSSVKLDYLMLRATTAFASAFLLGKPLDVSLMHELFPMPVNQLRYPVMPFPRSLLPQMAKARVVVGSLFEQMQASPRWPEIKELAAAANYDETKASGDVLGMITLNADGLTNPWTNALALLQLMGPSEVAALKKDEQLRNSFCWELMRFNSARSPQIATSDVAILDGGKTYWVKKGTKILGILGLAQQDPAA